MAIPKMISLGCVVLLLALVEATPPGIENHPAQASCKIKRYKMCYNLVHVCPEFCPDACEVECASCKPICTPGSSPSGDDTGLPAVFVRIARGLLSSPPSDSSDGDGNNSGGKGKGGGKGGDNNSDGKGKDGGKEGGDDNNSNGKDKGKGGGKEGGDDKSDGKDKGKGGGKEGGNNNSDGKGKGSGKEGGDNNSGENGKDGGKKGGESPLDGSGSTPRYPPPAVDPVPPTPPTYSPPAVDPVPPTPPTYSPPAVDPVPPTLPSSPPLSTPSYSPPPTPMPTPPSSPSPTRPTYTPPPTPTTPPSSPSPTPPTPSPSPPTPSSPPPYAHPPTATPSPPTFVPTPSTPTPVTPTPSTLPSPPWMPSPPSATPPTPSSPSPITPTPPSSSFPTPSPPWTPSPSTPTTPPSSEVASQKRVRCRNNGYGSCYGQEFTCPANCPTSCQVDCNSCKPVCSCDYPGAVCQDPRFIGGDGITFYFHGKKDQDFCLVSDPNFHINAHFIGKRNPQMTRDFTWVQSLGILFNNHRLYIGAQKTATWKPATDRLSLSLDDTPIYLPETTDYQWQSSTTPQVTVTRTSSSNKVVIHVQGTMTITTNVVPITEEESRVHRYDIRDDDCFAHLDLGFKFHSLSSSVDGVLGKTYRDDYVSNVKMGASMPIMGGDKEYSTSNIFATDCSVSRFNNGGQEMNSFQRFDEFSSMNCWSGIDGEGVVCKR